MAQTPGKIVLSDGSQVEARKLKPLLQSLLTNDKQLKKIAAERKDLLDQIEGAGLSKKAAQAAAKGGGGGDAADEPSSDPEPAPEPAPAPEPEPVPLAASTEPPRRRRKNGDFLPREGDEGWMN